MIHRTSLLKDFLLHGLLVSLLTTGFVFGRARKTTNGSVSGCLDGECPDKTDGAVSQPEVGSSLQSPLAVEVDTESVEPVAVDQVMQSEAAGVFEGDEIGIQETTVTTMSAASQVEDSLMVEQTKRWWPDSTVPFAFSHVFRPAEKKIIHDAMEAIQQKTCAKFRAKTDTDVDYLQIDPGFGYDYIDIIWSNINEKDRLHFNTQMDISATLFGLAYDFASIMHYGTHDFARDPKLPTIMPKPGQAIGVEIGQRKSLSPMDIQKVNYAYCGEKRAAPCPTIPGWTEYRTSCLFFSFFADANINATYREANAYCRKKNAAMANPKDSEALIHYMSMVILGNPYMEKNPKAWIVGCQSINASNNTINDEDSCDSRMHFVCEQRLKRTS